MDGGCEAKLSTIRKTCARRREDGMINERLHGNDMLKGRGEVIIRQ